MQHLNIQEVSSLHALLLSDLLLIPVAGPSLGNFSPSSILLGEAWQWKCHLASVASVLKSGRDKNVYLLKLGFSSPSSLRLLGYF